MDCFDGFRKKKDARPARKGAWAARRGLHRDGIACTTQRMFLPEWRTSVAHVWRASWRRRGRRTGRNSRRRRCTRRPALFGLTSRDRSSSCRECGGATRKQNIPPATPPERTSPRARGSGRVPPPASSLPRPGRRACNPNSKPGCRLLQKGSRHRRKQHPSPMRKDKQS